MQAALRPTTRFQPPAIGWATRGLTLARLASPSIADVIFLGCLFLAIAGGSTMLSADGDPARHLAVGEYILSTGSIPRADLFSHTMASAPFVPYEWLAEVGSALSFRVWGTAGPVLLHGGAIALTFSLLYAHLRRRGHAPLTALVVTMAAAAVSTGHWLARPHVFTFLGAALTAALLDGWRHGWLPRRALWLLAPLMVLWANLHGGFLIGIVLIGISLIADVVTALLGPADPAACARVRLRQAALPTLAAVAAPAVNPAGLSLWTHVTGYFGKSLLVDLTQEYMAPSLHDAAARPFYALLAALFGVLLIRRTRPDVHQLAIALTFSTFALYAARNVPLFAIAIAPVLAASLEDLPADRLLGSAALRVWQRFTVWLARRNTAYVRIESRAVGHSWPALVVGGALLLAASARDGAPLGIAFHPQRQPVQAVAFLAEHPPSGPVFNELGWGGYLLHTLWPAQRVFIDGQTDFYGEALAETYLGVRAAEPGWQTALDRYGVTWAILPPDAPLMRALRRDPAWRTIYEDENAVVVAR